RLLLDALAHFQLRPALTLITATTPLVRSPGRQSFILGGIFYRLSLRLASALIRSGIASFSPSAIATIAATIVAVAATFAIRALLFGFSFFGLGFATAQIVGDLVAVARVAGIPSVASVVMAATIRMLGLIVWPLDWLRLFRFSGIE